jgi:hypothetical protein
LDVLNPASKSSKMWCSIVLTPCSSRISIA